MCKYYEKIADQILYGVTTAGGQERNFIKVMQYKDNSNSSYTRTHNFNDDDTGDR